MSDTTVELGELVGKGLTENLSGKLLLRAGKAAAVLDAHLPGDDNAFGITDVDNPLFNGDGYSTKLLATGAYAKQPELFTGPFLQLGTYLKGKGHIDSSGLALALDVAVDPLSWATTGTLGATGALEKLTGGLINGLTEKGIVGRLASAYRAEGSVMTGAEMVTRIHADLERASKIAHVSGDVFEAAKLGQDSAIKTILKTAVSSGEAVGDDKLLLDKLLLHKKAIGDVLEASEKAMNYGPLKESEYLGKTIGEKLARKQIEPLIKFAIPNPNPLHWPRQLLGMEWKGDRFFVPGTTSIASGLKKASGFVDERLAANIEKGIAAREGEVQAQHAQHFKDAMFDADLNYKLATRDVKEARAAVEAGGGAQAKFALANAESNFVEKEGALHHAREGLAEFQRDVKGGLYAPIESAAQVGVESGVSAHNVTVGMSILRVMAGTERDSLFTELGAQTLKNADLTEHFRTINQLAPGTKIAESEEFQAWRERLVNRYVGIQKAADQARVRAFNGLVDETVKSASALAPSLDSAIKAGEIDAGYAEQLPSMLRRIRDDFSLSGIRRDVGEPGFGLPARQSFATMIARQTAVGLRDLVAAGYKGTLMRESAAEILGPAIAHPELWEERAGRLFLKADMSEVRAASPFLDDILLRASASEATKGLGNHMRNEGMDTGLSYAALQGRRMFEATGDVLLHEGVVQGLIKDYFPRIFTPNKKFFAEFGGGPADVNVAFERFFSADRDEQVLSRLAKGKTVRSLMDKAGQNRLTMAEQRAWTEELALAMEKGGYGHYVKDGPELIGRYMEAAHSALMVNRLIHDLPKVAGGVTYEELAGRFGKEAADRLWPGLRGKGRVIRLSDGSVTKEIAEAFTKIDPRYRTTPLGRSDEAILSKAIADEARYVSKNTAQRAEARLSKQIEIEAQSESLRTGAIVNQTAAIAEGEKAAKDASVDADKLLRLAKQREAEILGDSLKKIEALDQQIQSVGGGYAAKAQKSMDEASSALEKSRAILRDAEQAARERVAAKLHGKTSVYGIRLRMRDAKEAVSFQDEWLLLNSYPKDLVGWKSVKGAAQRAIKQDEIVQRVARSVAEAHGAVAASANRLRAASEIAQAKALEAVKSGERAVAKLEAQYAEAGKGLPRAARDIEAAFNNKMARAQKAKSAYIEQATRYEALAKQAEGLARDAETQAGYIVRGGVARETQETAAKAAELGARRELAPTDIWVFNPDYAHLQDALHLYSKGAGVSSFMRAYRDWNYRFKSVLLLADIYHLNTLAFTQLLTDQGSLMKLAASAKGLKSAAIGAAVGAGLGLASKRDETGTAALSIAGAVYGLAITQALARAGEATRFALNPEHVDTLYWMGRGGFTGRPDDRSIGVLAKGMKAMRDQLARDVETGTVKARIHPVDGVRHVTEWWEHNLWEVMHSGSKHFYFDHVWRRALPKLEESEEFQRSALLKSYDELLAAGKLPQDAPSREKWVLHKQDALRAGLSREIVQSGNNAFGGQTWRYLLDNPNFQRTARDFLLAPDWTASRLAMTATYLMNTGPMVRAAMGAGAGAAVDYFANGGDEKHMHLGRAATLGAALFAGAPQFLRDAAGKHISPELAKIMGGLGGWADGIQRRMLVKGDVMRLEAARMSAAALIGGYTMMNGLNYAFTGHFMFDNDEDRKTQIDLGDGSYVSMGKPWVEAFEFAGVYHPHRYPSPGFSRLFSKTAPIPHMGLSFLLNVNEFGGPLIRPEDGPIDIAQKESMFVIDALAPIGTQGLARTAGSVGSGELSPQEFETGLLRTAGFQSSAPSRPRSLPTLNFRGLGAPPTLPSNRF